MHTTVENIKLYRQRFMPNETTWLKDDIILFINDEKIITKWKTLKPRKDFTHGYSYYCLNENFKISKFFNEHKLTYIYCDIIETIYKEDENIFYFNDLLADIVIYDTGFVKILDLDELADAVKFSAISNEQTYICLKALDKLLDQIYTKKIDKYLNELDTYIAF